MRRLKEQVRKGELPVSEALEILRQAAIQNNDWPRVCKSKTWKWLARRAGNAGN